MFIPVAEEEQIYFFHMLRNKVLNIAENETFMIFILI